ncbi:MAG: hypothetical protein ACYDFT_04295, partial [Thermoplasmata archaeon]
LLLWLADRPLPAGWLPAAAAFGAGLLLTLPQGFAADGSGAALVGGVLVGSPILLLAALLTVGRRPAAELALVAAGSVLLLLLGAAQAITAAGAGPGPLAAAVATVLGRQDGAWTTLVGGSNPAAVPLQFPSDGILAGLLLLAWAGAYVGLLAPAAEAAGAEDAPARRWLAPIGFGVGAALLFELALIRSPDGALLGLALAVIAAVAAILILARRRAPGPARAARPARPVPGPSSRP